MIKLKNNEDVIQFTIDVVVEDWEDEYTVAAGIKDHLNKDGYKTFSVVPADNITDYYTESKVVKEGYGPTSDIKEFIKLYMQDDSLYSIEDYIDDFYDEGEISKSQRDSLYAWAEKWVEIR